MNIYSILPLLGSFIAITAGVVVLLKNKKYSISLPFFSFCLSIFVWLFSYFIAYSTNNTKIAFLGCNLACTAVIFTAPTAYHFIVNYLQAKRFKIFVGVFYILMTIFVFLFFFTKYFLNTPQKHFWGYYSKAGPLHPLYLAAHFTILLWAFFLLYNSLQQKNLPSIEKLRIQYIFLVYTLAAFGGIDFIQKYGVEIYPFGSIFVLIFVGVTAYAILKTRLMDIRLVITRATVFILVYSLVFAIPIVLGLTTKLWIISIILMGILSPIGMFVYSSLRQQLENTIFKEQQRYQAKIKELAQRLMYISQIDKLLSEIVPEVNRLVNPEFIALYVLDNQGNYTLTEHFYPKDYKFLSSFENNHPIIEALYKEKSSLLVERYFFGYFPFETVAIPFYTKDKLYAFIILGPKPKKAYYFTSDFTTFDILSFQVSLALQNIYHLEELRQAQIELLRQENLKFVALLVKGLAHEILNPLTPLIHRIEDLLNKISLYFPNIYSMIKLKEVYLL